MVHYIHMRQHEDTTRDFVLEYAKPDDDFWEDFESLEIMAPYLNSGDIKEMNDDKDKAVAMLYNMVKK